ncbi:hypothetical protein AQI70_14070 [Streptomyces curacoi]|uniref:Secreted protein n=1 Tax=Streptomyces curacoi TaxID=146536 RepID=A0A124H3B4_9ACTN|nr:hypothetical protein AQI70_14070 [Streptomyces curacoi]
MATQKRLARRLGSATLTFLTATTVTLAAHQWRSEKARLHERRLELEELAIRRTALAHQQRMHWELLARAIDDPSLAAVIDTYDQGIPAERRRQFFYANAWYVHLYHLYQAELLDREELYTRLREFFQSPVFREYWEASRHMRASLDESSVEAQLGHMVDGLVRDLDESDTDEWWVVGEPPTD